MSERSRRETKSKLDKLAEYKRARQGGARNLKVGAPRVVPAVWPDSRSQFEEEDDAIYDVVSEDQYKTIVRGRLAKDDFVVDDGVGGYMDNGMDDFDETNKYAESEDEEKPAKCA